MPLERGAGFRNSLRRMLPRLIFPLDILYPAPYGVRNGDHTCHKNGDQILIPGNSRKNQNNSQHILDDFQQSDSLPLTHRHASSPFHLCVLSFQAYVIPFANTPQTTSPTHLFFRPFLVSLFPPSFLALGARLVDVGSPHHSTALDRSFFGSRCQ